MGLCELFDTVTVFYNMQILVLFAALMCLLVSNLDSYPPCHIAQKSIMTDSGTFFSICSENGKFQKMESVSVAVSHSGHPGRWQAKEDQSMNLREQIKIN